MSSSVEHLLALLAPGLYLQHNRSPSSPTSVDNALTQLAQASPSSTTLHPDSFGTTAKTHLQVLYLGPRMIFWSGTKRCIFLTLNLAIPSIKRASTSRPHEVVFGTGIVQENCSATRPLGFQYNRPGFILKTKQFLRNNKL
jgi:hypothetical protein